MQVLVYTPGASAQHWYRALQMALPDARVRMWQEGDHEPADYAMVWRPPSALLAAPRGLKAVFSLGAGVDAVTQFMHLVPRHVPIIRIEDAGMAEQMADYVTYAVLSQFRQFDHFAAAARQRRWEPRPYRSKRDCTIGVLGMGALGQPIARRLQALGFPVVGWRRTPAEVDGITCLHGSQGLDQMLHQAHMLVCVLPLTPETTGLLNARNLAKLPRGAYLINVGRGAHVVEADLLKMVHDGHLSGAMLDVFEHEPLAADHAFWTTPGITVTPHISALSLYEESVAQMVAKIAAFERGEAISGVVSREKGY